MAKIQLGITGATGRVGRTALDLIDRYLGDKFEVTYVAASERSANKRYEDAIADKPVVGNIPSYVKNLIVEDSEYPEKAVGRCRVLLSAVEVSGTTKDGRKLSSEEKAEAVRNLENAYADRGIFVVSSNSAHRWTSYVPMVISEINHSHLALVDYQRKLMNWTTGGIIVKPNCAEQSFMLPIYALINAGFPISDMAVTTQQALSGAGDSGDSVLGNKISRRPHDDDEMEKIIKEPPRILGAFSGDRIINASFPRIGAIAGRDCVADGHSASMFIKFADKKPSLDAIIDIWNNFQPDYSREGLCLAPEHPIIYTNERGRPRPDVDLATGKGMTVTMGQLRRSTLPIFDVQCVGFSNNMVRGAAGVALYGLEVAIAKGYVKV